MKANGLIIEDDSPKSKKPANPFSFFASSATTGSKGGSTDAAAPKKSVPAPKGVPTGRAQAPYSIFDEGTKTSKGASTKPKSSTRPTQSGGGAPSIFDEPPKAPSAAKRAAPAPAASTQASVIDDGFDRMKERLAEQEKLKRKVKEQTTGSIPTSSSSSSSSSTTKGKKKENPFSFKNFASAATRGDEEKDMDDDGEQDGGGPGADGEDDSEEEQVRPGENPFSFKAFAKKSGEGEKVPKQQSTKTNATVTPVLPSISDDDDDEDEDEAEEAVSTSSERRRAQENPYSFKAFAGPPPPSSSSSSSSPPASSLSSNPLGSSSGRTTSPPSLPLPAISDSEEEEEDEIGIPSLPAPHTMEAGLMDVPDFSVEADGRPVRGAGGADGAEGRLRTQIEELKALLLRAETKAEDERKRASTIERRALKAEKAQARLRKKEEEDTKQLNDVVQAIEHNLMLATARAEKAESRVQHLEDQLTHCSCGRGSGHGGAHSEAEQQLRTIHEQSAYLTSQLHKAANDAEEGIKKLVGGVATLRDIAAVLKGIDKLSHTPAHDSSSS